MGTITKLNDVLCANINKVDDILKSSIKYWDDNTFCPPTPTPTPTPAGPTPTPTTVPPTPTPEPPTPTPTPEPTQCPRGCCNVELCYSDSSCGESCLCNRLDPVYLGINCETDACILANAYGIFVDDKCGTPAAEGYYSDGTDCYYWDGGSNLNFAGGC
jgi:hypothetical protein